MRGRNTNRAERGQVEIPVPNHGGRLREIVLFVTTRCDLHCLHCDEVDNRHPRDFPCDLLSEILPVVRSMGARRIALSGGEPHLHPRFDELIRQIVDSGLGFSVVSNGRMYNRYLRLLRLYPEAFHAITFSLDGAREEVHDGVRGPGSFDLVCEAIRCFALLGRRPAVNICLHRRNVDELEDIGRLAVRRGAAAIGWLTVDRGSNPLLCFEEHERREVFRRLFSLYEEIGVPFNLHPSLFRAYKRPPVHFCEMFDLSHPAIDYTGRLRLCCNVDKSGPHFGDLRFEEIGPVLERGKQVARQLKAIRARDLQQDELEDDFSTCDFCSRGLREVSRTAKGERLFPGCDDEFIQIQT